MLLIHQAGSVKIGEVVRYTVTYIPSQDRILPSPERLYVRMKNTSAIALRAAFVHGPYTLCVSAYPSNFDPNEKFSQPRRYGVPECEPMLKAGGSWECELVVPDDIRQSAGTGSHGGFGKSPEHDGESATWIIEVASQVIFSTSAVVGYEMVVARDKKSLNLSSTIPIMGDKSQIPQPGRISDYQQSLGAKDGHHPAQPKGVFSRSVRVKVEDTATLWNTPRLPGWDDAGKSRVDEKGSRPNAPVESMVETGDPQAKEDEIPKKPPKSKKPKKVHLVVLTHGLHSNLGADMLFMKESIDAAVKQAKVTAKKRKAEECAKRRASRGSDGRSEASTSQSDNDGADKEEVDEERTEDEDDEEVIVRGYSGNATKTERGIKYLGKRLARYVLAMTYPDQPFVPIGKGMGEGVTQRVEQDSQKKASHKNSTIHKEGHREIDLQQRSYKITSISFIAHSLGGNIQTYAVAYIQKHSPEFFDLIKPINFIALATPFLGLSNENPRYVKFALDFGLVGRTGKDLGLTWRAPTIARSGWGAIVGNLGETAHKRVYGDSQPESKPLLRILPTGPAHTALLKFRNRTVYSNVVNDGIVPLRTSCLLFLDWQGLGRVQNAWRDIGLVETMVGFGWAELTGTKMTTSRQRKLQPPEQDGHPEPEAEPSEATAPRRKDMRQVPQPDHNAIAEDDRASIRSVPTPFHDDGRALSTETGEMATTGPLAGFFNLFRKDDQTREKEREKVSTQPPKQQKIFRSSQTMRFDDGASTEDSSTTEFAKGSKVTTGHELEDNSGDIATPPKTTFFESAGDLLNPKIPDVEYLIDPAKRPRTIFHVRVYHPEDIPPPPLKEQSASSFLSRSKTFGKSASESSSTLGSTQSLSQGRGSSRKHSSSEQNTSQHDKDSKSGGAIDNSGMRVEEKIARGYHRELSWRKVLVKLEPDAHNNIFVRRKFVNAFGWPVIKHLTDVHFSDSITARTRTDDENPGERAKDVNQPPDEYGGETKGDAFSSENLPSVTVTSDVEEASEARDQVPALPHAQDSDVSASSHNQSSAFRPSAAHRVDSMAWSERDWSDSDNDSDYSDSQPPLSSGKGKETKEDDKEGEADGRSSPLWDWTEKIVGKGGAKKFKSPNGEAGTKDET